MSSIIARAPARLGAVVAALAWLAAATPTWAGEPPAKAGAPARAADTPRHGGAGGGLLLISFFVSLPLSMTMVAPAAARSAPAKPSSPEAKAQPSRRAAAP